MTGLKELYEKLNSEKTAHQQKYPELFKKGNEIRILYVGSLLNKSAIYRFGLPKLELNGRGYSTVLQHFMPDRDDRGNMIFLDHWNLPIRQDLITWADYIVLAPVVDDIFFMVKDIRKVNKNAVICFDLDKNYQKCPAKSSDAVYYDLAKQKMLLSNISRCDILIVPDGSIMEFYDNELKKYHPDSNLQVAVIPNLISGKQFEEIIELVKNGGLPPKNDNIFTVLIYAEPSDYDDINSNRDILEYLLRTYPQTKIVVFGDNMNWKDRNALREIRHEFVKQKSYFDYLTQIARIQPDVAFIPISHRDDYYRTNYKMLELSALEIPIITYNVKPYSNYNDILLLGDQKKDIKEIFDAVIKDKPKLDAVGAKAHEYVWKRLSFNENTFEFFANCYFATV